MLVSRTCAAAPHARAQGATERLLWGGQCVPPESSARQCTPAQSAVLDGDSPWMRTLEQGPSMSSAMPARCSCRQSVAGDCVA